MCIYIIFFPHVASVNVRKSSPKQLGMNKFVRTKSRIGSEFSKIFFEQLYTGWIVVVHLYCGFLCGVRWRHNRAPNLKLRFLVNFVPV